MSFVLNQNQECAETFVKTIIEYVTASLNKISVVYGEKGKFDFSFSKVVSLISLKVLLEEKLNLNFYSNFD